MTVLTAYNRTNMKMMFVMTAFFFVVAEGLFRIMFYNTVAKVRTYVQCIVCFTALKNCLIIMCVSSTFSSSSFPYHSYFPSSLLPYSFSLPLLPCSLPLSPLLTSLIFYSPTPPPLPRRMPSLSYRTSSLVRSLRPYLRTCTWQCGTGRGKKPSKPKVSNS